jgi:hypothetical protein
VCTVNATARATAAAITAAQCTLLLVQLGELGLQHSPRLKQVRHVLLFPRRCPLLVVRMLHVAVGGVLRRPRGARRRFWQVDTAVFLRRRLRRRWQLGPARPVARGRLELRDLRAAVAAARHRGRAGGPPAA